MGQEVLQSPHPGLPVCRSCAEHSLQGPWAPPGAGQKCRVPGPQCALQVGWGPLQTWNYLSASISPPLQQSLVDRVK